MNTSRLRGDLPEPVRRYFLEVAKMQPPADLLDAAVAEIERTPRINRFAALPIFGFVAAAAVVIGLLVYTFMTPAARPRKKKISRNHGPVSSHPSRSQPSHAPMTIASTNENPTVLNAPIVRTVSGSEPFFGPSGSMTRAYSRTVPSTVRRPSGRSSAGTKRRRNEDTKS